MWKSFYFFSGILFIFWSLIHFLELYSFSGVEAWNFQVSGWHLEWSVEEMGWLKDAELLISDFIIVVESAPSLSREPIKESFATWKEATRSGLVRWDLYPHLFPISIPD